MTTASSLERQAAAVERAGFLISIPVPPSVNNLFANSPRGGRYRTKEYLAWINEAGWTVKQQRPQPVHGKYRLFLTLPKIRGDVSNRVKAAEDLLVSLGLIDDDRHCVHVQAFVDEDLTGHATISVESVEVDTFISLGDAAAQVVDGLLAKLARRKST